MKKKSKGKAVGTTANRCQTGHNNMYVITH